MSFDINSQTEYRFETEYEISRPDYLESRGDKVLLIWSTYPYWIVINAEGLRIIDQINQGRTIDEVFEEYDSVPQAREKILTFFEPFLRSGVMYPKGNPPRILSFAERCAAGAGTFIEAMARALEVKLEEMGPLSLKAEKASSINSTCVVFGESDVITMIHRQESKLEIARAIFDALADRVSSMLYRLGISSSVVLIGGVARDVGFIASLKRKLGTDLLIPEYPEFAGALGAALDAAKQIGGGKE